MAKKKISDGWSWIICEKKWDTREFKKELEEKESAELPLIEQLLAKVENLDQAQAQIKEERELLQKWKAERAAAKIDRG